MYNKHIYIYIDNHPSLHRGNPPTFRRSFCSGGANRFGLRTSCCKAPARWSNGSARTPMPNSEAKRKAWLCGAAGRSMEVWGLRSVGFSMVSGEIPLIDTSN